MKNKQYPTLLIWRCFFITAVVCLLSGNRLAADVADQSRELRVVCTTTMLGCVIDAVGGENINARVFVPFGMCPGHFDLTPGEAGSLREADLVFFHGFEQFLDGVNFTTNTTLVQVTVGGNWMIPEIHKKATIEIAGILSEYIPEYAEQFTLNTKRYVEAIETASDKFDAAIKPYTGVNVICSLMNRDFVERMGMNVLATFPRDEDMSLKSMNEIITLGQKNNAAAVIDNTQTSGKTGRAIADDLKIPLVIISNFPQPATNGITDLLYIRALQENSRSVIDAIPRPSGN